MSNPVSSTGGNISRSARKAAQERIEAHDAEVRRLVQAISIAKERIINLPGELPWSVAGELGDIAHVLKAVQADLSALTDHTHSWHTD